MKQRNKRFKLFGLIPLQRLKIEDLVVIVVLGWSFVASIFPLIRNPIPDIKRCYRENQEYFEEKKFQKAQKEIFCEQNIQNTITAYILLLVSTLTFAMIVERYRKIDSLQNTIDDLQSVINLGVFKQQVTSIVGAKKWFKTAKAIMEEAENTIYDISLSSRTWYGRDDDIDRKKFNKIRQSYFKNPLIETKYLTTFKTYLKNKDFADLVHKLRQEEYDLESHRNKLEADIGRINMIQELKDYNFRAAYLRDVKLKTPLLSFLIVDNKKVLLGFYQSEFRESNIGQDKALLIENEEVADLFYQYFDLLWNNSTKLAHDSHELEKILNKLTTQLIGIKGGGKQVMIFALSLFMKRGLYRFASLVLRDYPENRVLGSFSSKAKY